MRVCTTAIKFSPSSSHSTSDSALVGETIKTSAISAQIAETTFTDKAGGDFSTSSNITSAEDLESLCSVCNLGIDDESDFSLVGINGTAPTLADRGLYNSGVWGKGAVIYGSSVGVSTNVGVRINQ